MRFLADENFPRLAVNRLREFGYDVKWIKTDAPGISDEEVMAMAFADKRILLTFDKDFGELVFHKGRICSYGIILFRLPLLSADDITRRILFIISSRDDWKGQFTVADTKHIRIRSLP